MKTNRKIKKDIILIAALVLAGAVIAAVLALSAGRGGKVTVKVDGQVIKEFSLSDDVSYEIDGADGGHNILKISRGSVWMEDADCPDGLCVHMGRISRAGQSIVCLPHKVIVEISSDEVSNPDIDIYVN